MVHLVDRHTLIADAYMSLNARAGTASLRSRHRELRPGRLGPSTHFTEYLVNAPPACTSEFGPSAA
jgi:hypothetical protein